MYRRFFTWYERVQLLLRKNKVEGGREGGRKEGRKEGRKRAVIYYLYVEGSEDIASVGE